MRILGLLLASTVLISCGDECVEHDLTGAWTENDRSSMTLTQTCEGTVTGKWTMLADNGTVMTERNISGDVIDTRFTFVANCVDDRCTYPSYAADGADGTGADILDDGDRIEGAFSVPGRANGQFTFTRD